MRHCVAALIALVALVDAAFAGGLQPGIGVFRLYYSTNWATPHLYYNPNGAGWVDKPGPAMKKSENSTYQGFFEYTLAANQVTFVLNDGGGQWDNNGGKDYKVQEPGVYTLKSGSLTAVEVYPKGCPNGCSGHGACQPSFQCACSSGWSGPACTCSPGLCGAHGECDAQGDCKCSAGWSSCNGTSCGVDTSSDINNCGACGASCAASGSGVDSAKCSSSTCHVSCRSGYVHCVDAQTQKESCHEGSKCPVEPLPGCQTFNDNHCEGSVIDTDDKFADNKWFTPRPGDEGYQASYGDYWRLVGHVHVEYNAAHTSAVLKVIADHKDGASLTYEFDGVAQGADSKTYTTANAGPVTVTIIASDGAKLKLQDVDLVWSAPPVNRADGDFRGGQKGAVVELFGWPHKDIEEECESLSKMGWAGVKVFPVMEQVMSFQPMNNIMNPWYFMYQPVSYRFAGRLGTHEDLRNMIYTCRKYGVRVYADAVVNHMTGNGNDMNPKHRNGQGGCTYWGNKTSSAADVSPYYTQGYTYTINEHTGKNPLEEFPAVPFGPLDFHCERSLSSWNDGLALGAGWLSGLVDLHTGRENVRERIADYLTSILSIGFSGFRIDAAKHIFPEDLVAILSKVRRNMGGSMPGDWFTWLEVLTGGEASMLLCNAESGYNYGKGLENMLVGAGWDMTDVNKVKIWLSGYPSEPTVDCGAISRVREVIQNDDHDQQNPGSSSRDMHDKGNVFIKTRDVPGHRNFEVTLFKSPFGVNDNDNEWPIRMVLSSFFWGENGDGQGIPDGLSDCKLCQVTCGGCHGMPYSKAHDPNSCGYDLEVYTRTHRDFTVIQAMRQWMKLPSVSSPADLGLSPNCK